MSAFDKARRTCYTHAREALGLTSCSCTSCFRGKYKEHFILLSFPSLFLGMIHSLSSLTDRMRCSHLSQAIAHVLRLACGTHFTDMHAYSAHARFGCRAAKMDCTRNALLDRCACASLTGSTHRTSLDHVRSTGRCSAGPLKPLMRSRNGQATNTAWGFRGDAAWHSSGAPTQSCSRSFSLSIVNTRHTKRSCCLLPVDDSGRAQSGLAVSPLPADRGQRCSYSQPGASSGTDDEQVEPNLEQLLEWATEYGTTMQPYVSNFQ